MKCQRQRRSASASDDHQNGECSFVGMIITTRPQDENQDAFAWADDASVESFSSVEHSNNSHSSTGSSSTHMEQFFHEGESSPEKTCQPPRIPLKRESLNRGELPTIQLLDEDEDDCSDDDENDCVSVTVSQAQQQQEPIKKNYASSAASHSSTMSTTSRTPSSSVDLPPRCVRRSEEVCVKPATDVTVVDNSLQSLLTRSRRIPSLSPSPPPPIIFGRSKTVGSCPVSPRKGNLSNTNSGSSTAPPERRRVRRTQSSCLHENSDLGQMMAALQVLQQQQQH